MMENGGKPPRKNAARDDARASILAAVTRQRCPSNQFEMALREREATSTPQMIRATANLTCPYACSVVRDNGGQTTVEAGEITGMSAV